MDTLQKFIEKYNGHKGVSRLFGLFKIFISSVKVFRIIFQQTKSQITVIAQGASKLFYIVLKVIPVSRLISMPMIPAQFNSRNFANIAFVIKHSFFNFPFLLLPSLSSLIHRYGTTPLCMSFIAWLNFYNPIRSAFSNFIYTVYLSKNMFSKFRGGFYGNFSMPIQASITCAAIFPCLYKSFYVATFAFLNHVLSKGNANYTLFLKK